MWLVEEGAGDQAGLYKGSKPWSVYNVTFLLLLNWWLHGHVLRDTKKKASEEVFSACGHHSVIVGQY